jgi:succinate dehydrogenase / fumarate reductase, iron-sulfur subunit
VNFHLKVWRQPNPATKGKLRDYEAVNISPNTSFLEMLDIVNEELIGRVEEPIAFDSDCREGICGTCSLTINGEAHGPDRRVLGMVRAMDAEGFGNCTKHLRMRCGLPGGDQ